MAALTAGNDGKGPVTVMVEVEKACYPICTLQPSKIPQQALDYIFTEGEEVLFYTEGDLDVHLTGYLIDEPSPFEYSTDEDESASESNAASSDNEQDNKKKRKKSDNESSEEEALETLISELDGLNDDNENMVNIWLQRSERNKRRKENVEDESATPVSSLTGILLDNGDSEGSEDDDWIPGSKRKPKKKQKAEMKEKKTKKNTENYGKKEDSDSISSPSKLNSSKSKKKNSKNASDSKEDVENLESSNGDKDGSQDSKLNSEQNEVGDCKEQSLRTRELPGGLMVEDLVKGEGKKAKKGRQVSVYYKGYLKKTMKEFDSCLKGKPFTFRVGQGEVIKGWDNGVEGMQIGGKRRLIVPPTLGYGSKPIGSSIPPNSTLIFVVELLKVH